MNKQEIIKNYLTVLSEIHNKKLSESSALLYWKVLKGFTTEQLEKSFDTLIKTSKYFPKPVEIIDNIVSGKEDQSLSAWVTVIDTAKKYGYYSTIDFGDPIIAKAVSLVGGWKTICHSNVDELVWKQKEFERVYKNLLSSNYSGDNTIVKGYIEQQNTLKGEIEDIPEPIKVFKEEIKLLDEV